MCSVKTAMIIYCCTCTLKAAQPVPSLLGHSQHTCRAALLLRCVNLVTHDKMPMRCMSSNDYDNSRLSLGQAYVYLGCTKPALTPPNMPFSLGKYILL